MRVICSNSEKCDNNSCYHKTMHSYDSSCGIPCHVKNLNVYCADPIKIEINKKPKEKINRINNI